MKNRLLILLAVLAALPIELLVCLGQSDGGVSVGPGATTAQALFPTSSYTNLAQYVAEVRGFTYGTTNPVDMWGAYEYPLANGHYTYSQPDHGYTNINHVYFYLNTGSSWEIGLTNNDPNVNTNWYYYFGSNPFPTNSYANWSDVTLTIIRQVDVGTLISTNYTHALTPTGFFERNLGDLGNSQFQTTFDGNGNTLLSEFAEGLPLTSSTVDANYRIDMYAVPGPAVTNYIDANHGYVGATVDLRINGNVTGLAGDNRSVVLVGGSFFSNNLAFPFFPQNAANLGGWFEMLVKRSTTYTTPEIQGWNYIEPWKVLGDGSLWAGNNPQGEHTQSPLNVSNFVAKAWFIARGSADRPFFVFPPVTYTGPLTNTGIYADANNLWLMNNGSKGPILASNTPTMVNGTNYGNFTFLGSATITNSLTVNSATITNSLTNAGWTVLVGPLTNGSTAYLSTNTAPFNVNTNDLVPGAINTGPAQRFSVKVNVFGIATLAAGFYGALMYSNAADGRISTAFCYSIPAGLLASDAVTNTLTLLDGSPNSLYWVTNTPLGQSITVIKNTSTISTNNTAITSK